MNLRFFSVIILGTALTAFSAWALDLHEARVTGAVGEKLDGYVEALQHSPAVTTLVNTINAKRKQEYERIAKEKNQSADVVAKLAAPQIISGLESGASYQASDGSWKKK